MVVLVLLTVNKNKLSTPQQWENSLKEYITCILFYVEYNILKVEIALGLLFTSVVVKHSAPTPDIPDSAVIL